MPDEMPNRLAILRWLLLLAEAREGASDDEDLKVDAARLWLGLLIRTEEVYAPTETK